MPNPQLTNPGAITESDWKYYLGHTPESLLQEIAEGLKNENRYFVDKRFQRLLFTYFFDPQSRFFAQTEITPSATLYRARIYNEPDAMERYSAPEKYDQFQGMIRARAARHHQKTQEMAGPTQMVFAISILLPILKPP